MFCFVVSFACLSLTARGQAIENLRMPIGAQHSEGLSASTQTITSPPATGRNYFGFDLGMDYSAFVGQSNFFYALAGTNFNGLAALQYDNLGGGIGGILGAKAGFAIASSLDIEGKLRYRTNYTASDEVHTIPCPDANNPNATTQASNSYTMRLDNIDLAALLHYGFSDQWYGVGGLCFSTLISNRFAASQQLSGGCQYIDQSTGTLSGFSQITVTEQELTNYFTSSRADIQLGVGSVFPLGGSSSLLDAEFLLSIPLTDWLQSGTQTNINSYAPTFNIPQATFPKLWYASLTIGIRFPLGNMGGSNSASEGSDVIPASTSSNSAVGSDGKVMLSGRVTDAKTGEPVDATMTVVDLTNNEVVATDHTDHNGDYNVRVKAPGKYSVTADADGYLFGTSYFEVDDQGRILSKHPNISLSKATGGRTRLLVFFDFNKSDLSPSSYPELNRAVRLMKAVPAMQVEIAGYSDSVGKVEYNRDLSQRRANAVRDYLVHEGISRSRVTAHGYGGDSPIADNSTENGRAENRRVEFVVISK